MKLSKIYNLIIVCGLVVFFSPIAAQAATLPDLLPACVATGACRVCDIVNIGVTLGRWLIAGAAALALLVIVWAGSGIVMSAGNAEKIGAAKKQIVGALLGVGIVLAAFQFVGFIIFALTTPSAEQNFATSQVADTGNLAPQNLGTFLGIPWWKLCDAKELLAAEGRAAFPSTGNCAYWGDGTVCDKRNTGAKKCCQGKCQAGECVTTKVVAPVAGPAAVSEGAGQIGALALGAGSCIGLDTQNETSVQDCLKKAGIRIVTINYTTTVAGLSRDTIDKLIRASAFCNFRCISITGGTEKAGHAAKTSHGNPNVVDIDITPQNVNTIISAVKSVGLRQVDSFPGASGGWFICDESGQATECNTASHLHVQF